MKLPKPQIIDLFAGVGGFTLGAIRAGFHLALAVELDEHAMASHQLNFPGFNHLSADISCLDSKQLMRHAGLEIGELEGLVGGPPCQGFSLIGKRNISDNRNNLFVKFFELVKDCRPKFFIVENVLGILHKQYSAIRDNAFGHVRGNYTLLEPMKLKASDFGAPTSRERVFFIGYRSDITGSLSHEDFEYYKVESMTTVADALFGLPSQIDSNWLREADSWRLVQPLPNSPFYNQLNNNIPKGVGNEESLRLYRDESKVSGCFGTRHAPDIAKRYGQLKSGERDPISKSARLELDGFCPTLRAGTGPDRGSYQAVRPIHPIEPRVITPREAARLQGFPDWFRFAPSKWHSFRQIGNSVSPILAEVVFRVIGSRLNLLI